MYKKKINSVSVKKIAEFLESDYNNEDFEIDTISSLNNVKDHSILFYTDIINFKFKLLLSIYIPKLLLLLVIFKLQYSIKIVSDFSIKIP